MPSSITVTWYNEGANTTHTYVHEMSDANMERIIEAGRTIYGIANTQSMLIEPVNKNRSRRLMTREAIRSWKERARAHEIAVAQANVMANIAEIDTNETAAEEN